MSSGDGQITDCLTDDPQGHLKALDKGISFRPYIDWSGGQYSENQIKMSQTISEVPQSEFRNF
jgi:hypothetical protein